MVSSRSPSDLELVEIYSAFLQTIERFERSEFNKREFLCRLSDLSDRQWHTYTLLSSELQTRIELLLISLWNGRDLKSVETILYITAHLGLDGLFSFICSQGNNSLSPEVIDEIKSAVAEFGTSVGDPFIDLN